MFLVGLKVIRMKMTLTNSCLLLIQLSVFNLVPGRCISHKLPREEPDRGESLSPTPKLPVSCTLQLFAVTVQLGKTNRKRWDEQLRIIIQSCSTSLECIWLILRFSGVWNLPSLSFAFEFGNAEEAKLCLIILLLLNISLNSGWEIIGSQRSEMSAQHWRYTSRWQE